MKFYTNNVIEYIYKEIYSAAWSFCKTCVAMKFVDDDDDDKIIAGYC